MQALLDFGVPAVAVLLQAAVGVDLTADDFARIRRGPAVVVAGLLGPVVLLPMFAAGLSAGFSARPEVTAGLLLIAVCPVGGMSNVFSYLAGAAPALSVTLTALSCLLGVVTIPLTGAVLETLLGRPLGLVAPLGLLGTELLGLLAAPLALGFEIRRRWPAAASRYRPALRRVSFIGVGLLVALIVADDPRAFGTGLRVMVPMAALFVAGAFVIGWSTGALVTRDPRVRFTLASEFGTRNVGVAIAIAVTVLGRVDFARVGAAYFLTEVPLMLLAVTLFARAVGSSPRPEVPGERGSA